MRARAGLGVLFVVGVFAIQCGGDDESGKGSSGGNGGGGKGGNNTGGLKLDGSFAGGGGYSATGNTGFGATGGVAGDANADAEDAAPPKPCQKDVDCDDGAFC